MYLAQSSHAGYKLLLCFIYFRFAFRHLWKNKLFSIINIVGLSLGLACCFIILLHVRFETGFDRFHKNRDRIIRVLHDQLCLYTRYNGNGNAWLFS